MLFKPSEIVIDDVVPRLVADYDRQFGAAEAAHRAAIADVARLALGKIARSDALYHDLEYTLNVTLVMQELLEGKRAVDGEVSPRDWTQMVCAALCFAIGFVRGAVPGDEPDRYLVGDGGATVGLADGATDAALGPWAAERSMLFVRRRFAGHPVLDADAMAEAIAATAQPVDARQVPQAGWPALLRAAQILGMVADPNFPLKLKALFLEIQENGQHELLGYKDPGDLARRYPTLFWSVFAPHLGLATRYLNETGDGRQWLANMNAHLLAAERQYP